MSITKNQIVASFFTALAEVGVHVGTAAYVINSIASGDEKGKSLGAAWLVGAGGGLLVASVSGQPSRAVLSEQGKTAEEMVIMKLEFVPSTRNYLVNAMRGATLATAGAVAAAKLPGLYDNYFGTVAEVVGDVAIEAAEMVA